LRDRCWPSIPRESSAFGAQAQDRGQVSARAHHPDSLILGIGDEQIASGIKHNAEREIQFAGSG